MKTSARESFVPQFSLFLYAGIFGYMYRMKKLLYIFLAAGLVTARALPAQEREQPERPKVAVVLSGGGAKGVAHIGALRVIEEAGIPIDMIVGTSMGSIIGGLYSIGYTPGQLDSMVLSQDWKLLLSDRVRRRDQTLLQKEADTKYVLSIPFGRKFDDVMIGGLIKGSNLDMLFNDLMVGFHDTVDFRKLPIPFACVATDITEGKEVVFYEGALPTALRASMAIPAVFTPVYTEEMVLVDGGLINNFPTNIAMQMGADVIIGVDVQSSLRSHEELHNAPAVLAQIVELSMQQHTYHRNVNLTDVYIKVNVDGYSSASFNRPALDSLIRRGRDAAMQEWHSLLELKDKIGLDDAYECPPHGPFLALSERGGFNVYDISFEGLTERQKKWIMRKCKIRENSRFDVSGIEHCVSMLNATQAYAEIYYTLLDTLDGYNLRFNMAQKKGNSINIGGNFDTEEIASIILNGTLRFGKTTPSQFSLTGRFGKRIAAQADLFLYPGQMSNFNFSYAFHHNDIFVNENGRRLYNPTFNRHVLDIGYNEMNFIRQKLKLSAGIKYDHYIYLNALANFEHEGSSLKPESEGFVSYYASLLHESLNNRYFPRRGTSLFISYELYTDNFVQYKDHSPFAALAAAWATAIPITSRFSLMPSIYGRVLSGTDIPFSHLNMIGGKWFGRYFPQQMPFDGIGYVEAAPHAFVATKLKGQYNIARHHYVMASVNYAMGEARLFHLFEGDHYIGASIDYGFDGRLGPILASFNWSNVTKKLGFYVQVGYTF